MPARPSTEDVGCFVGMKIAGRSRNVDGRGSSGTASVPFSGVAFNGFQADVMQDAPGTRVGIDDASDGKRWRNLLEPGKACQTTAFRCGAHPQTCTPWNPHSKPPCHGSYSPFSGNAVTCHRIMRCYHPWEAHPSWVALGCPSSIEGPPLRVIVERQAGNVKRKTGILPVFSDSCIKPLQSRRLWNVLSAAGGFQRAQTVVEPP